MRLAAWAQLVKERDGWTCQQCGSMENLHAHHIKPRALGGKNTLANGKTLCASCHNETHTGNLSSLAIARANGYEPERSDSQRLVVYVDRNLKQRLAADAKQNYRSITKQLQMILDARYA